MTNRMLPRMVLMDPCPSDADICIFGSASQRLDELEKLLSVREVSVNRLACMVDGMRNQVALLPKPDFVFIATGLHKEYGCIHQAVVIIRACWGDVPIVLCGNFTVGDRNGLCEKTGVDALLCARDEASLLHLLATFGFRVRKRRAREMFGR